MPDHDISQPTSSDRPQLAWRVYLMVLLALQLVMLAELAFLLISERWMHAFLVLALMAAILTPALVQRKRSAVIPLEIQIVLILFIFATLFLGEIQDYYERIWWYDLALHGTAGLLLGLLGFMIVYILNEDEAVDLHMRPSFLALFAFFFAVGLGALWEIFEFGMDKMFGFNMQKPMLGDPSGLTNTMWDLILDSLGAGIVSLAGWRYMSRPHRSYIDSWGRRFIERHPQLFERDK